MQSIPPPSTLGCNRVNSRNGGGFTLVELSIVLVIIGLIVGGVMVGRDLIKAAEVRAQISQIEQYKVAVNTFKVKYGYLPGDMPSASATAFGFYRSTGANDTGCTDASWSTGCGNGNNVIGDNATAYQAGESHLFWLDLSLALLIKNSITTYDLGETSSDIYNYLPPAKLNNQYVYAWSGGVQENNSINYLTISGVTRYCSDNLFGYNTCITTSVMRVADAYNIDQKIDDAMPQSGKVLAIYIGYSGTTKGCLNGSNTQALWVGASTTGCWGLATTSSTAGSSTTCYDNNNTAGAAQKYSTRQNGGDNLNCALSFAF